MTFFSTPSLVGLLLQAVGALMMAMLCLVLLRTVRRQPLMCWTVAWFALTVALVSLWISFGSTRFAHPFQTVYLLGEYVFGFLVFSGCRRYATGAPTTRKDAWLLVPGVLVAVWLPRLGGGDFNVFFTVHTVIYAYLFFISWRVMRQAERHPRRLPGLRVMQTALVLLTISYLHYAPLFAASSYRITSLSPPYLVYSPFYDLLFLGMLMFGMVMVVTGDVQLELEVANAHLAQTRDRLEGMAQLDHLTSALNRHAFYSLIDPDVAEATGRPRTLYGCAAIADIDGLKQINDRFGHPAGDAAIRAVASAIRTCIRADDLLVRWGGDEFLILLIGVSEAEARARLESLNHRLRQTALAGLAEPVDLSVSVGFAAFDSAASLDEVIAVADRSMYGTKKQAG